jgi:hypothetical protein
MTIEMQQGSSAYADDAQPLLNLGHAVVAVDPGSLSTGVALVDGAGHLVQTWSLRAPAGSLLHRQAWLSSALRRLFATINRSNRSGAKLDLVVEDGIFHAKGIPVIPIQIGTAGEMRGLIMAEAWRAGWAVRKMPPLTWKSRLSKDERRMKKDSTYVAYWKRQLSADFESSDEVDAAHIGLRAVVGK